MPTVEFADGGIGVVENSGGMFALFAGTTTMLAFAFVFDWGDPQAKIKLPATRSINKEIILNIDTDLKAQI